MRRAILRDYFAAGLAATLIFSLSAPLAAQPGTHADIASAITSGDTSIDLRYRYEFVDQDALPDDANASTLRLRLNYQTGDWQSWSGFVEFDQVIEVLVDDFNSGSGTSGPNRSQYPVVADPDGADLNQLYFQYAPHEQLQARIGRQRILLDDQRFVGGVGWRQNEQTYDALSVQYTGFEKTKLSYSYVANANRIFGAEVPAGDHDQDTHLLNASVELQEDWTVVGYAYLIDNDDAPAFSTNTIGGRLNGAFALGEGKAAVLAEIARQSDAGNATANFDADYFRVQGTWTLDALSLGLGFESLGSDNGEGFRTPLATLHAFNGWADQFLGTPGTGLDDLYVKAAYQRKPWNFQLAYHDFSAQSGGGDYGSEIDLSAGRAFAGRYKLLLKLALFDADSPAFTDTTKAWLMLAAGF
ncbi:MAG: alginate export family protein [Woeseiaceae bacterium]|nr:alginate export family protein [Woeseiaceae bacterium]